MKLKLFGPLTTGVRELGHRFQQSGLCFPTCHERTIALHSGQDNMAAAAGRYYGEGGRATKRQKTEDGGMTTVRALSALATALQCVLYVVGVIFLAGAAEGPQWSTACRLTLFLIGL